MDVAPLIISIVSAAGLGGVVGAYYKTKFGQEAKISDKQQELKQKRYLCILILLLAKIDEENNLSKLTQHRPDIKTSKELDEEIKTELLNAIVYSNDEVLKSLSGFVQSPQRDSFYDVASAIRNDLWGRESQLSSELKTILSKV